MAAAGGIVLRLAGAVRTAYPVHYVSNNTPHSVVCGNRPVSGRRRTVSMACSQSRAPSVTTSWPQRSHRSEYCPLPASVGPVCSVAEPAAVELMASLVCVGVVAQDPFTSRTDLLPTDSFILLCCDGVWCGRVITRVHLSATRLELRPICTGMSSRIRRQWTASVGSWESEGRPGPPAGSATLRWSVAGAPHIEAVRYESYMIHRNGRALNCTIGASPSRDNVSVLLAVLRLAAAPAPASAGGVSEANLELIHINSADERQRRSVADLERVEDEAHEVALERELQLVRSQSVRASVPNLVRK